VWRGLFRCLQQWLKCADGRTDNPTVNLCPAAATYLQPKHVANWTHPDQSRYLSRMSNHSSYLRKTFTFKHCVVLRNKGHFTVEWSATCFDYMNQSSSGRCIISKNAADVILSIRVTGWDLNVIQYFFFCSDKLQALGLEVRCDHSRGTVAVSVRCNTSRGKQHQSCFS
jgi:hypothetical protein